MRNNLFALLIGVMLAFIIIASGCYYFNKQDQNIEKSRGFFQDAFTSAFNDKYLSMVDIDIFMVKNYPNEVITDTMKSNLYLTYIDSQYNIYDDYTDFANNQDWTTIQQFCNTYYSGRAFTQDQQAFLYWFWLVYHKVFDGENWNVS